MAGEILDATSDTYHRSEYEVVSELLAESRIELNLQVLSDQEPDSELAATVDYWSKRAREIAKSANETIFN